MLRNHPLPQTGAAVVCVGVLKPALQFLRTNWIRFLVISAAIIIPCFWHSHIEAGDLGSHVYNAWLVQLIDHHQVSGLWVARQWNNVLFDILLSALGTVLPLQIAARIIVALSVLLFFWSAFAFVAAASGRPPWTLLPLLAMVCYGWTFNMGFCNYYLAVALSFLALAVAWRGSGLELGAVLGLAGLALLAHPLGLVWLGGACLYILVAERTPQRYQIVTFGLAVVSLFVIHRYLWSHFEVVSRKHPFYFYNGMDQLVLFGPVYLILAIVTIAILLVAFLKDVLDRQQNHNLRSLWSVAMQLYILLFAAVVLLPDSIKLPQYPVPVSLLSSRLTSVSAVLVCCLAGALYPRNWHILALGAVSLVFFSFFFIDTARVDRLEEQAEQLIQTLPPGQRVIVTVPSENKSRLTIEHVVDSACINHCFTYSNYEASSGQFRVRALPGNRVVTSDQSAPQKMYAGIYEPQPWELPIYQIYLCSDSRLCIRQLTATGG